MKFFHNFLSCELRSKTEKAKVFYSKTDILKLLNFAIIPKKAIIFPKSEKYFLKTIDKAGRWVYNDTVI